MFFDLRPLSFAAGTEDLHFVKLCGAGALCFFSSVQWYMRSLTPWRSRTSIFVAPHPWWWLLEAVTDHPCLGHWWHWQPSSPVAFPGCWARCQFWGAARSLLERVVLKQLHLSVWDQQQLVGLSGKPHEMAVGRTGLPLTSQPFSSPKPTASRSSPKALATDGAGAGSDLPGGCHGLPGHQRDHWGTTDRVVSHGWVNWLCVPCMLYLRIEKDSCTRPFLFFTMLVFHRGKYRPVEIFTPTSRIQSYVSSAPFIVSFGMHQ